MAVLLKCGALFLHIPKTGGNWVTEVLEEAGLVMAHVSGKHASDQLVDFESFFRQPYAYSKPNRGLYKFCFVRHPLRWYESWFRMQQTQGWPVRGDAAGPGGLRPFWNPTVELDGLGSPDFSTFVRNVLRYKPGFVTSMYHRYVALGTHFVGRQEALVDDTIHVLRKELGLHLDEAAVRARVPVNVSKSLPVVWEPGLAEEVLRTESGAMAAWYGSDTARTSDIRLVPPYKHCGGHCYSIPLPYLLAHADIENDVCRSLLALYEGAVQLRKPHAPLDEIVKTGTGAYKHWKGELFFSPSDNSDPNTNGREYRATFKIPTPDYVRVQMP